MNNYDQMKEMVRKAQETGGNLSTLMSDLDLLSAGGKTSIGLNRWTKTDKPQMEDFNSDNEIIDREITALKLNMVQMPIEIKQGADLNDYITPGFYFCRSDGSSIQNAPVITAFSLLVERGAAGKEVQTLKTWNKQEVFLRNRYYNNGTPQTNWQPWVRFATTEPPRLHNMAFTAGLTASGQYFKTQDSIVTLSFSCRKATAGWSTGEVIATLPVGYRSTIAIEVPSMYYTAAGWTAQGSIYIRPDGQIQSGFANSTATGILAGTVSLIAQ